MAANMSLPRLRDTAATVLRLCGDVARFGSAAVRSHAHFAAENLFLRKQLALYVGRQVKPRRADDATRIALVALSWLVDWRRILTIVQEGGIITARWRSRFRMMFSRRRT